MAEHIPLWRAAPPRVASLDVVDVVVVDRLLIVVGLLLLLVLVDIVGWLRGLCLFQLGDLCALVIFNFHVAWF